MSWLQSPVNRGYLYTILIAAGPVLVFYGIMTDESMNVWGNFVAALLMIGSGAVARANTPNESTDAG